MKWRFGRWSLATLACLIWFAVLTTAFILRIEPWQPRLRIRVSGVDDDLHFVHARYSPDGRYVVVEADPDPLILEARSGRRVGKFIAGGHRGKVTNAVFSEDGQWLFTGGDDGRLCVWDFIAQECLRSWPVAEGACVPMMLSPDGLYLLCTGGWPPRQAHIVNHQTGRAIPLDLFSTALHFKFSPDSRQAAYMRREFIREGESLGGNWAESWEMGIVDLADGSVRVFVPNEGLFWGPIAFMDGSWVWASGVYDEAEGWQIRAIDTGGIIQSRRGDRLPEEFDNPMYPGRRQISGFGNPIGADYYIVEYESDASHFVYHRYFYREQGGIIGIAPDGKEFVVYEMPDRLEIWRQRRPVAWWGVFWLPELWLALLFLVLSVLSVRRDRRRWRLGQGESPEPSLVREVEPRP